MQEYNLKNANEFPDRWQHQKGILRSLIQCSILLILNLVFLGVYAKFFHGSLEKDEVWFLIMALMFAALTVFFIVKYARINYGYNGSLVYYHGIFYKKKIPWQEVELVEEVKEWRDLTPEDIFRLPKGNYNVRIVGKNTRIAVARYDDASVFFRDAVSAKIKKPAIFNVRTKLKDFA